jgi:hypothetical protein
MNLRKHPFAAIAAITMAGIAMSAHSQTVISEDGRPIEQSRGERGEVDVILREVTVTSTRSPRKVDNVPNIVSVTTAEEIQEKGILKTYLITPSMLRFLSKHNDLVWRSEPRAGQEMKVSIFVVCKAIMFYYLWMVFGYPMRSRLGLYQSGEETFWMLMGFVVLRWYGAHRQLSMAATALRGL